MPISPLIARTGRLVLVATLVAFTAAVLGCGKTGQQIRQAHQAVKAGQELEKTGQTTIKDEEGNEVTIKTGKGPGAGTTSVETKEGSWSTTEGKDGASWSMTTKEGETASATSTTNVSEADLGIKFYPGATVKSGSKTSSSGPSGGSWVVAELVTPDAFDKVAKFYKNAYGKTGAGVTEAPGNLMVIMDSGGGNIKTVTVTREEGSTETSIALASGATAAQH